MKNSKDNTQQVYIDPRTGCVSTFNPRDKN